MDVTEDALPLPTDLRSAVQWNDLMPTLFPVAPLGNGCFRATPTNHEFR